MTKVIRVDEAVHGKVRKIAEANFRGLGDQVAFWAAMDCPHPAEMRKDHVAHVEGTNDALRFFHCGKCGRNVFVDATSVKSAEKKRSAAIYSARVAV